MMNPFDMLIAAIVAFCVIRGVFRGLINELSSIIGVMAGFYAAYTYYVPLAKLFLRWMDDPAYANIISFLIIFSLIYFIVSIAGVVIKYALNIAFMGWFDRICGACFGLIKGVLIASVLFLIFTAFLPKGAPVVKNSVFAPHLAMLSGKLAKVVNQEMKKDFGIKIDELQKYWRSR
jgi:membrane protein required for colicin V production